MDTPIRILALNGSPKKDGNTVTAISWVTKACEQQGAIVDWLHVSDLNINYCLGCFQCLKIGYCIQNDDLLSVMQKIERCHGLIIGSPVYEGYPTAQLKTIMDRLALLKLYTGLFEDKFSIGISTSGIAPTNGVARQIADFFGWKIGKLGFKTATISGGYFVLKDKAKRKQILKAHKLGTLLVEKCRKSKRPFSLFYIWIMFLRKHVLWRIISKNPSVFGGIIGIWKAKGWFNEGKK